MTRIAALVLSHNDASTVGEAIGSIAVQQSVSALSALVLADDASADDTVARARAAAGSIEVTVRLAQPNLGQWPNLNRALDELAGSVEWVLILHADDVVTD